MTTLLCVLIRCVLKWQQNGYWRLKSGESELKKRWSLAPFPFWRGCRDELQTEAAALWFTETETKTVAVADVRNVFSQIRALRGFSRDDSSEVSGPVWGNISGQSGLAAIRNNCRRDITSRTFSLRSTRGREEMRRFTFSDMRGGGYSSSWTRLQPLRNRESTDLHTDLVYMDSNVPVISLILVLIRVRIWCLQAHRETPVCVISASVQVCDLCRCLLFTTREI